MKEGIAMNIVQLNSSLQENSRKRKQKKELNYTYGIVTTGTTWWYIMFVDEGKDSLVYTSANKGDDTIPLGNEVL
ncbi:5975_t:CDS:2 [Entrophospora sp. SA101]|nr:5975_t:CDS:2 [Entrophospora sp. SA101]